MAQRWNFAVACALLVAFSIPARAQSAPATAPLTIFFTAQSPASVSLTPADLRVTVDKKPVQVLSVRPAKSDKLLFALLVDTSGSQMKDARPIRETATRIFQELSFQGGVGYLGTFSDDVRLSQAPVSVDEVQAALSNLQFSRRTALWDAIGAGVHQLSRQAHPGFPRRAIIVISDGGDNNSHANANEVRDAAEREGIALFWLNTGENEAPTVEEQNGQEDMRRTIHATGGETLTPATVGTTVTGLLDALDHQWELTIAAPSLPSGKLYALSVKTTQKHVQITAPEHITLP